MMLVAENRFIRSTHDKHGNVRQDIPKLELDDCTWILHMLLPNQEMTFNEVVKQVHAYNQQESEPLQHIGTIALGLVRLIEADMARVVRYHKTVMPPEEEPCGDCGGVGTVPGRRYGEACTACEGTGYVKKT